MNAVGGELDHSTTIVNGCSDVGMDWLDLVLPSPNSFDVPPAGLDMLNGNTDHTQLARFNVPAISNPVLSQTATGF